MENKLISKPNGISNQADLWVRCFQCKKPVDKMIKLRNEREYQNVYKVYCHGESEITELDDIIEASAISITPGVAFINKKLSI